MRAGISSADSSFLVGENIADGCGRRRRRTSRSTAAHRRARHDARGAGQLPATYRYGKQCVQPRVGGARADAAAAVEAYQTKGSLKNGGQRRARAVRRPLDHPRLEQVSILNCPAAHVFEGAYLFYCGSAVGWTGGGRPGGIHDGSGSGGGRRGGAAPERTRRSDCCPAGSPLAAPRGTRAARDPRGAPR